MAEREGFEPSVSYPTAVFKTAALNHSTISPEKCDNADKIARKGRFFKFKRKKAEKK